MKSRGGRIERAIASRRSVVEVGRSVGFPGLAAHPIPGVAISRISHYGHPRASRVRTLRHPHRERAEAAGDFPDHRRGCCHAWLRRSSPPGIDPSGEPEEKPGLGVAREARLTRFPRLLRATPGRSSPARRLLELRPRLEAPGSGSPPAPETTLPGFAFRKALPSRGLGLTLPASGFARPHRHMPRFADDVGVRRSLGPGPRSPLHRVSTNRTIIIQCRRGSIRFIPERLRHSPATARARTRSGVRRQR